jgi:murein DD-endopeptidase / murein LD-carboxypeptidase
MAVDYAARALALTGVPFRPQGRDPRLGLDCVGLCLATYDVPAEKVRRDYRIRGDHRREITTSLLGWFRKIPRKLRRIGDLLLLAPADDQLHLAIQTEQGFVHADARLRRVVQTPGNPPWAMIGAYRRRVRS